MTSDFIEIRCRYCDYCIFECGYPTYCGEIDDEGCVSDPLKSLTHCRLNYPPIKHVPKFQVGWRLECSSGTYEILAIEDDKYVMQKEGVYGKFGEPYPIEKHDTDEIDGVYGMEDILLSRIDLVTSIENIVPLH